MLHHGETQAQVWFPGQFPHDRVWGFDRQHFMCHLTSKKSQRAFSFWAIGIRHRKLNEMEAMVERNSEMPDESDALMYVSVFWQHWESRSFQPEVALNFSTMAAQRSQGWFCSYFLAVPLLNLQILSEGSYWEHVWSSAWLKLGSNEVGQPWRYGICGSAEDQWWCWHLVWSVAGVKVQSLGLRGFWNESWVSIERKW